MMIVTYRHGLRVSELIDLLIKDLDLETSRIYVRRKKGSLSTHQPIEGDELRAIRAWLREREQRSDKAPADSHRHNRGGTCCDDAGLRWIGRTLRQASE